MNVLVTGAGSGIGRATALRLAGSHDIAVGYNDSQAAAAETVSAAERKGCDGSCGRRRCH